MLAGGREIITDGVFVEAPLPPPPLWGKRSPRAWGVWSRMAWMLGRHENGESLRQAEVRAEAAVATLTARALRGENVLLCAHGWFNRMMRPVLRAQGWREVEDCGDRYWSYRRYEKVK
jgi:broad specificity phosphatase PhoE